MSKKVTLTGAEKRQVIGNTATDTPFLFESFNSLVAWQSHPLLALVNLGFAGFVAGIRYKSEKAALGKQSPATKQSKLSSLTNKFVGNLGASLEASGILLGLCSVIGIVLAAASSAPLMPALILGAFGLANFARGFAMRFKQESAKRKLLDTVGIGFAALGCILVAPASPLAVKAVIAGAAALEAAKGLGAKFIPNGVPDTVFAAGLIGNAFFSGNPLYAIANIGFAAAFVSLAATKTKGGPVQWLRHFTGFKEKKAEPTLNP